MGSKNVLGLLKKITNPHFSPPGLGTSEEVILVFFSCFFKIYVNLWYIAIKDIFLFFLLTITGGNEATIVELKELFVLNGAFITCSGGSHH